ncbi:MAG: TIGR00153 family protein [Gammaproteobacteria bacterium]
MAPTNYFSRLFGKSPVSPLQRHMEKVCACVTLLVPFFEAVLAEDWEKVRDLQGEIAKRESEADDLKHELRLQLPKGMMLAMSRRDLLEVLTMQDKLANKAKDIAGLITGRQMVFPEPVGKLMLEFVKRSVDAALQAQKAINELDELVETGFRGHEVEIVESMLEELDRIESDTDDIQVKVRAELFKLEDSWPAVKVIFIYQIIDWVGNLGDRAQRVGSRLQLMLAR